MSEHNGECVELNRMLGYCEVNDVILSNQSRYMLAKMEFALSSSDLRKAKRHLKDCLKCRDEIAKLKETKA